MSRAEGIAKLLREHKPAALQVSMGETCQCGYWTGDEVAGKTRPVGFIGLDWHRAQVVDAWLAGQEREEWGIEWDNLNGGSYIDAYSGRVSAETAYHQSYSGALRTVRRYVTEWEDPA